MTTVLITLVVGACVGSLLGMLAGWLVRGHEEVTVEKIVTQTVEKIVEKVPEDLIVQRDQAAMVLAQLEQLACGVSEQITAHSQTVGSISAELSESNEEDGGVVVAAIKKLIESNNSMQAKLDDAQNKLRDQAQQLQVEQEQARTDQLTKLRNRRAFDDELNKRADDFISRGKQLSVMLIDVDFFKKFNDTHGHLAGDEVLRSVGRVLTEKTFGKTGLFAARYGGEEFAVVFSDHQTAAAAQIGERIRDAIGHVPVTFEDKKLQVTASAGMAVLQPGETLAALIARADEALYASKKAGRNCCHLADQGALKKVERIVSSDNALEEAPVDHGENIVAAVGHRIAEWRRGGNPISVVVARIDNLAAVESSLGLAGVEKVREIVRKSLANSLRDMDVVAPWLGEFYAMMLPTAKLVDAARSAERMRTVVEKGEAGATTGIPITLSLGVAEVSMDDEPEGLMLRARRAMEQARRKGGNAVFIHDGRQSDYAWDRLDPGGAKRAVVAT